MSAAGDAYNAARKAELLATIADTTDTIVAAALALSAAQRSLTDNRARLTQLQNELHAIQAVEARDA